MPEMNCNLKFALLDTRENPLAFDGTLWHGTAPFQGDRWVITAYTCRNLDKLRDADVQALHSWGFPLPQSVTLPETEAAFSSAYHFYNPFQQSFACGFGDIAQADKAQLAQQSVPLIAVPDLQDSTLRHQIVRCSADGVFSTIFIKFSGRWSATHNIWVLQLCKLAFSCGTTVHLDISAWDNCWYDPLFIHCVATGFRHIVQIPPCAFQGKAGRPWIMVSSSEAFASLGEVCSCKRCIHCSGDTPYPSYLIEAFGKFFLSADGTPCVPGAVFSVQHAWDSIPGKSVDEPPHAWVDGGG